MTLSPASRLGPYEILGLIGAGGMGEVYRARDPRLGREVAIKILPASVSGDADRVRRFEQEARAAGVLNHPNITAVYDIGRDDGLLYVVSELLEGETLRSRMGGTALSMRRAVDYALQLAHGLAAAHEKGIVHRDLKPENVFVTKDGRVKILDFGLAKLTRPEEGVPLTSLPTATAGTEPGVVMGTLGYMSPEQVRGKPADGRSDIFSFGAILYEMLSGQRAFHGDSAADTMSAILKEDPPELSVTNRNVSPGLDRIVRHCLEKNPEQRFHSAHDLAFDLEALSGTSVTAALAAPAPRSSGRTRRMLVPAGLLLFGLVVGALVGGRLLRARPPEAPVLRFLTFSGADWGPSASPDGKFVAFLSDRDGIAKVWLKELAGGNEVALTGGPEEAAHFSSDGASIFFLRREGGSRTLYRIPVVGGEPRRIRQNVFGASVGPDGQLIAFTDPLLLGPGSQPVLSIAAADGTGSPRELARFRGGTLSSLAWSPDGQRIAAIHQDPGASTIPARLVIIGVAGGTHRAIVPARARGLLGALTWDPSGRSLLYTQMEAVSTSDLTGVGRLFRCDLQGARHTLLLSFPSAIGMDGLSVAGRGRLLLDADASSENLLETSESGAIPPSFLTHGSATDRQPAYSPDGEWVVFSSSRSGNWDLWQVSRRTGAVRRLTDDPGHDWDPAFTPDGKKLVWSSNRTGPFEIWIAEADGSAPRQVTRDGVDAENPTATPDGRWIVYDSRNPKHSGLWVVQFDGSGARRIVEGRTRHPEVSPDGRYALFFPQDSLGSNLLRVVELPGGSPADFEIPRLMATRGRWMPDGRRIAFLHRDENGRSGLFVQDFAPGRNTAASRRKLAGFDPALDTESFGISPDGSRITLAQIDWGASLLQADGVPGIEPAQARP